MYSFFRNVGSNSWKREMFLLNHKQNSVVVFFSKVIWNRNHSGTKVRCSFILEILFDENFRFFKRPFPLFAFTLIEVPYNVLYINTILKICVYLGIVVFGIPNIKSRISRINIRWKRVLGLMHFGKNSSGSSKFLKIGGWKVCTAGLQPRTVVKCGENENLRVKIHHVCDFQ